MSVTDQGDDEGRLFIVMEHVRGSTLRAEIREHAPMAPARALALLEQMLQALAAAGEEGIVHRDIKPENVLISTAGQVKVAEASGARASRGSRRASTPAPEVRSSAPSPTSPPR